MIWDYSGLLLNPLSMAEKDSYLSIFLLGSWEFDVIYMNFKAKWFSSASMMILSSSSLKLSLFFILSKLFLKFNHFCYSYFNACSIFLKTFLSPCYSFSITSSNFFIFHALFGLSLFTLILCITLDYSLRKSFNNDTCRLYYK